jgi:hypothetical protein
LEEQLKFIRKSRMISTPCISKSFKDKDKLEWRYYMKGQSNFDRISKKWEINPDDELLDME